MKKKATLSSTLAGICMLFFLWQLFSFLVNRPILPSPMEVVPLFLTNITGDLGLHFLASAARVLSAIALATVLAAPLGLALGQMPRLDRVVGPLVAIIYPIPKIIFLPVIYVLVGITDISKVLLIAMMDEARPLIEGEPPSLPTPERLPMLSMVRGSLAGCMVGWFPGISSAQATIMAVPRRVGSFDDVDRARRFIAGVSAVNTANAVFVLVALATLLRVRSGATVAIDGLMSWEDPPWSFGTTLGSDVTLLMLAAAIGGLIAAPVTLRMGRLFQLLLPYLSHRFAQGTLVAMLVGLSYWTGGLMGLPVVVTAAALGLVPPKLGLMRVHLMGVVTLPLALGLMVS